jgi:hypothetical protein
MQFRRKELLDDAARRRSVDDQMVGERLDDRESRRAEDPDDEQIAKPQRR